MTRFTLRASTVALLRAAHAKIALAPGSALACLAHGIDADDAGLLVEFSGDRVGIDALGAFAAEAVDAWESGDLDGGDDVYTDLMDAIITLSNAHDKARDSERDGLVAAREESWTHGDDTPSRDSFVRNDAGEHLGIH